MLFIQSLAIKKKKEKEKKKKKKKERQGRGAPPGVVEAVCRGEALRSSLGAGGKERTSGVGPAGVGPRPTCLLSRNLSAARLSGKMHELGRMAPYSLVLFGRALCYSIAPWREARGWMRG